MKIFFKLIILFGFLMSCKSKKESAEFFNRGNYHFKLNEYDKAMHFYNEAILKDPELADAYNNRGLLYQKLGNIKEAEKDFTKAVNNDGSFTDAKLNLAKVYSETGNLEASEKLFLSIHSKYQNSSAYFNFFAQNYLRQNKPNDAKSNFDKAIKLDSKNYEAYTNLGYLNFIENDFKNAEINFKKALSIQPQFNTALNNMAVLMTKENKLNAALGYLLKIKEQHDILTLNNLAFVYLEKNDLKNAQIKVGEADKIEDKNPFLLRNKAILELKSGKTHEAFDLLKSIEKQNPEVDYIYYYLGQCAKSLGLQADSYKYFELGTKIYDGRSAGMACK